LNPSSQKIKGGPAWKHGKPHHKNVQSVEMDRRLKRCFHCHLKGHQSSNCPSRNGKTSESSGTAVNNGDYTFDSSADLDEQDQEQDQEQASYLWF